MEIKYKRMIARFVRWCLPVALLVTALLLKHSPVSAQLKWPAVTKQNKPWARWWWQGSAVNEKDLPAVMKTYSDAGLGGLEIVPIYGVRGYEQQFVPYLSPAWMQLLDRTLQQAKKLDLGIDMANGTGWPFGGPWITEKEAAKTVYHKEYRLEGGQTLQEKIFYQPEAFVRSAGYRHITIDQVKQPLTANNMQEMALDQVKFPVKLPAQLVVAYDENGKGTDITGKLDTATGRLNWTAPPGKWKLYALFQGMHGKMVERAAPGGEGYAVDHFSAPAIQAYFRKFDEAFKGHDLSYLRALFNDSYEVDDARGQANWTPGFLDEFRKRRGYDLRDHLPALLQQDTKENNSRIIYDYRETINELFLENFTIAWKNWGKAKGALIRNQSHGSPANILDLYAAIDIPETEGREILRFKFATSAANVTGKPLASSESATWLNEHFVSTLGDVKKAIDLYFLGGVNHIFYHGLNYSPPSDPWPGWLFYAAVHFQPTNPFWAHFPALNTYITRCQSFLQQGKPDNDVLLYYPLADRFADPGNNLLRHFDGMEKEFEGTPFESVAEQLLDKGFAFDYVSDKQLQQTAYASGQLQTAAGQRYQTIVVPAVHYIPLATWQQLLTLVRQGASLVFYRNLPADVPGYAALENNRKTFQQLLEQLHFEKTAQGLSIAAYGSGQVLLGDDIRTLLEKAGVRRESMTDAHLQFVRRKINGNSVYLVVNQAKEAFAGWVPLQCHANGVALYDAMTGHTGSARLRTTAHQFTEVYVQLQPGETILMVTSAEKINSPAFPYYHATGQSQELKGPWQLSFTSGGPVLPKPVVLDTLQSWTMLGNEDMNRFSGLATYRFILPSRKQQAAYWQLNLGKLAGSAEVWLNGAKLVTVLDNDNGSLVINKAAWKKNNVLEIRVANTMANRIIDMDKRKVDWKKFYNTNFPPRLPQNKGADGLFSAADWQPLASGLLGPVSLTPLEKE